MQGRLPDYSDPVVLPMDRATIEDFCNRIHKTFIKSFKHALVWGTSSKHKPQKVRSQVCCNGWAHAGVSHCRAKCWPGQESSHRQLLAGGEGPCARR